MTFLPYHDTAPASRTEINLSQIRLTFNRRHCIINKTLAATLILLINLLLQPKLSSRIVISLETGAPVNVEYLTTYMEVVRLGSFSEVAKRLSISQPAVSFQIHKLERDLGVRLLDRGQKTVAMTEAGKQLYRFAEVVEQERQRLMGSLEQLREDIAGNLVIAASTIPGEVLLPSILSGFRTLHPATGAQVVISDSMSVTSSVSDGLYDVGFCGTMPQGKALDSFAFAEDEIVLIVFPEHPFAHRERVSLLELEEEPLITREPTSGTQRTVESLLSAKGLHPEKRQPGLVLGSTQAVVAAVESKVGIAFVSNLAIKRSLALGLVKQVRVDALEVRRDFYCVYRKERVVSRLLAEFIAFVKGQVAQS
jgi:DNA-binding transcriptional LysR family regulator